MGSGEEQGSWAVPGNPPVGCGVLGAMGARPVEVEGVGVLGSPLTASVATGALGTGSFRGLATPGKR